MLEREFSELRKNLKRKAHDEDEITEQATMTRDLQERLDNNNTLLDSITRSCDHLRTQLQVAKDIAKAESEGRKQEQKLRKEAEEKLKGYLDAQKKIAAHFP